MRPDLDEEEFDLAELEKLRKPVSLEPFGDALLGRASDHGRAILVVAGRVPRRGRRGQIEA